jgi:hypothetical protein
MSRIPHFLDKRLTDDGEVVSLKPRQLFAHHEDSWYLFLLEQSLLQGHSATGRINNSMALVHEQTLATERPPLVGEVIANFCG